MLNVFVSILLLNLTIITLSFSTSVNKVIQTFDGINVNFIKQSVVRDDALNKSYFDKELLTKNVSNYFKRNLTGLSYSLTLSFREDDFVSEISKTPNIVQIDLIANLIFDQTYARNSRFVIYGREVAKDWYSSI